MCILCTHRLSCRFQIVVDSIGQVFAVSMRQSLSCDASQNTSERTTYRLTEMDRVQQGVPAPYNGGDCSGERPLVKENSVFLRVGGRSLLGLYSVRVSRGTTVARASIVAVYLRSEKRLNVPKGFENPNEILCMRFPAKAVSLTIALLVVAQFFAVVIESQRAALLSWYLIYALLILIPLTLVYEGVTRLYPHTPS